MQESYMKDIKENINERYQEEFCNKILKHRTK